MSIKDRNFKKEPKTTSGIEKYNSWVEKFTRGIELQIQQTKERTNEHEDMWRLRLIRLRNRKKEKKEWRNMSIASETCGTPLVIPIYA